jgi:hypothetical protein
MSVGFTECFMESIELGDSSPTGRMKIGHDLSVWVIYATLVRPKIQSISRAEGNMEVAPLMG